MNQDGSARPPRRAPTTSCVPLLFESAKPYYTAYAGSDAARAGGCWTRVFKEPGARRAATTAAPLPTVATVSSSASSPASPSRAAIGSRGRFIQPDARPSSRRGAGRGRSAHLRAAGQRRPRPPPDAVLRRRARGFRPRTGAAAGIAQRSLLDVAHEQAARAGSGPARASTPACRTPARSRLYEALRLRGARDPPRAQTTAPPARSAGRALSATSRPCRAPPSSADGHLATCPCGQLREERQRDRARRRRPRRPGTRPPR